MDNFIVALEDQSSLGDRRKIVAPFKLSKTKKKRAKKNAQERKEKILFLYKKRAG